MPSPSGSAAGTGSRSASRPPSGTSGPATGSPSPTRKSEELGYAIDAYSIQHEVSTHYGRMVATDDALMLFSDPTEVMEHLLS
jgi:hypothetical protein